MLWLCLVQLALWTLAPSVFFSAPPLDVVENIGWGREWRMGYYKHPPLQAWVTGLAMSLGGVWLVYLASQLCVIGTYWGLYLLGRDAVDAQTGLRAVLIYALCFYATIPTPEFNANIVLAPFWALSAWALWRALHGGGTIFWVALGALLAGAFYAKYSVIFLAAGLLIAGLSTRAGRRVYREAGPYVGAAVALALVAPHLYWLVASDFAPISYAMERSRPLEGIERLVRPVKFLLAQMLDYAAPLALLLIAGATLTRPPAGDDDARRFIDRLALAPLLVMVAYALARGSDLKDMWGAGAAIWLSLALALRLPRLSEAPRFGLARRLWLSVFIAAPLVAGAVGGLVFPGARPLKTAWPADDVAAAIAAQAAPYLNGPPSIVAGPTWEAGLLASSLDNRPSVFFNADFSKNPWITPERLAKEGAVFVWKGDPERYSDRPFVAQGAILASEPKYWGVLAPSETWEPITP